MLTRYHSDSTQSPFTARTQHSMDDQHHPVLVTKNNSGLLTQFSACGSEMIFDLLHLPAPIKPGSLKMSTNLLVPFIAFSHSTGFKVLGLCHNSI